MHISERDNHTLLRVSFKIVRYNFESTHAIVEYGFRF
jgi:hypothetical protein